MSLNNEKTVLTNGNHNHYLKNGTSNPKKRLFDWDASENYPQKLGEQETKNHVGVIVWCLVFTIVIVKFALYIGECLSSVSFFKYI